MGENVRRHGWRGAILAVGLLAGGCAPMTGSPSLSYLSRDVHAHSPQVRVIGETVEESDTTHWVAVFGMFGPMIPSHEAVARRLLAKCQADLLVDAEMEVSSYGIPYIYMQLNTTVRGRPAVWAK